MSSNAFTCLLWAAHFYRLVISGVISPFDLILHYLRTGAVCHWPVSVSWHAEHSEHRRHSRLSCSRCRRRVWLAPPTHTVDVRLCSFHLRLVGCRVLCCRFVPGLVWCWSRIHGCASSLVLDIELPSSVSPFHKTLSTRSTLW